MSDGFYFEKMFYLERNNSINIINLLTYNGFAASVMASLRYSEPAIQGAALRYYGEFLLYLFTEKVLAQLPYILECEQDRISIVSETTAVEERNKIEDYITSQIENENDWYAPLREKSLSQPSKEMIDQHIKQYNRVLELIQIESEKFSQNIHDVLRTQEPWTNSEMSYLIHFISLISKSQGLIFLDELKRYIRDEYFLFGLDCIVNNWGFENLELLLQNRLEADGRDRKYLRYLMSIIITGIRQQYSFYDLDLIIKSHEVSGISEETFTSNKIKDNIWGIISNEFPEI
jgi:hypothetical protein